MQGLEFKDLIPDRKKVGPAGNEEIAQYMSDVLPPLKIAALSENSETILDSMRDARKVGERQLNRSISRPALCADVVISFAKGYLIKAASALYEGNDSDLRFYFDLTYGVGSTAGLLRTADEHARGTFGEGIASVVPTLLELFEIDTSLPTQAESIVAHFNYADKVRNLLEHEPTGVSVMEFWAKNLRSNPAAIGFFTKEYSVAGSELAIDIYKGLYQIAGPIYPPKPS